MKVHTHWAGPLPDPEVDQSDIPDEYPDLPNLCTDDDSADDENSVEDPIEDSNHILVTAIPPTGGVCLGFVNYFTTLGRGLL